MQRDKCVAPPSCLSLPLSLKIATTSYMPLTLDSIYKYFKLICMYMCMLRLFKSKHPFHFRHWLLLNVHCLLPCESGTACSQASCP